MVPCVSYTSVGHVLFCHENIWLPNIERRTQLCLDRRTPRGLPDVVYAWTWTFNFWKDVAVLVVCSVQSLLIRACHLFCCQDVQWILCRCRTSVTICRDQGSCLRAQQCRWCCSSNTQWDSYSMRTNYIWVFEGAVAEVARVFVLLLSWRLWELV